MKLFLKTCVFIFALVLIFAGCKKTNDYPIEPVITFKSLSTVKDNLGYDVSASLEISFTDGDGDIGIDAGEVNNPPFVGEYGSVVHIHCYRDSSGTWLRYSDYDDDGWFRKITPEGNIKALRGDIRKDQIGFPFPLPPDTLLSMTLRYEVYIYDRALHKSNVITTPAINIATHHP